MLTACKGGAISGVGAVEEAEQFSSLIGEIYDTTLDRSLWPQVLQKIAGFLPGKSAAVFWNDAAHRTGDVYLSDGGIEPHYTELYFSKYIKLNPTATRHFFGEVGEPMATADLLPYEEFLQSRFYLEWARPQGLVDFISVALEKSSTKAAMFGVFRHERHGLIDDEARRRMRLLVPHIRRAVLIAKVIDLKQAEASMLSETVNQIRAAMILVDSEGHIIHANVSGHALLAVGDTLRAVGGRLASADSAVDKNLRDIFRWSAEGDIAIGTRGVAVPLVTMSGERYVAHFLPLTSGLRAKSPLSHSAVAAVFVHKVGLEAPSPPEAIAKAYKLTPTELRVVLAIVEVGGVPEVAEALGVAGSTVKTHLTNVYTKTGVSRQADLVKLVAGFANPLLD
jgi:DNA-binding CsgD family transcriptional regulator